MVLKHRWTPHRGNYSCCTCGWVCGGDKLECRRTWKVHFHFNQEVDEKMNGRTKSNLELYKFKYFHDLGVIKMDRKDWIGLTVQQKLDYMMKAAYEIAVLLASLTPEK